ncbi:thiol peroxidase (atypical 2-Cys peroxiredoxin) [Desulfobotulus alkaliphilus]|uniref:Thiol peroxidase n=1 Tax=Desulfobotulus alkaliphilus TaxID=622671 RepID=A0A562RDC9_9BACT|nr:thiol peroxidase [Desulfobotulus alkaliphilus]TWI66893.1 thiol peroxidase (atypical 2-Cys peroxiredoxin) [Desulfobotulus alkaliphilus]
MATVTLQGSPFQTSGNLPATGSKAPDFTLTSADLGETGLENFSGKKRVLNIFPSIDTGVCAASVRRFNAEAGKRPEAVVLCISADLPFAHSRFCGSEGLKDVHSASTFRNPEFGEAYGVTLTEGPLRGLLARAVVIIDKDGRVAYTELVPEIGQDPNFDAALEALDALA